MIRNKKVKNAFVAAVALRNEVKVNYLKSVHQSHDTHFIAAAERSIIRGEYRVVEGLTVEQEQLLADHESLVELINKIATYL